MKWLFIFILMLSGWNAFGQSAAAKRALKALAENDIEKAEQQIQKGLEKDSADALLHYDIARFQLQVNSDIPDSANRSERRARGFFERLTGDEREKYNKAGLTLLTLDLLRIEIDSTAFAKIDEQKTEDAFNYFLANYPDTVWRKRAILERDSLAYLTARRTNTYQSYREFMDKYPDAAQIALARDRYERLFYEEETADGSLESFEEFLRKNPATPYRDEIENKIFLMSAYLPETTALSKLYQRFKGRPVSETIRNFMYYQNGSSGSFWNDSLRSINAINSEVWVPTYEKEHVIFIDESSHPKFTIEYEALSDRYKCTILSGDVIYGMDQIYSRTGDLVFEGPFDSAKPVDPGYIMLGQKGKFGLITTWGRSVLPLMYDEIRVLSSGMIVARNSRGWALFTFAGMQVTETEFMDIQSFGYFHLLEKDNQVAILSNDAGGDVIAGRRSVTLSFYDEVEWLSDKHLWVKKGSEEALLGNNLEELIQPDVQKIEPLKNGFLIRRDQETIVYSTSLMQRYSTNEQLLAANDSYLRFSSAEGEGLFDLHAFRFVALPDSSRLIGRHSAIAFLKNGYAIYQYGQEIDRMEESFPGIEVYESSSREWLIVPGKRYPRLGSFGGMIKFPSYDELALLGDSLFIVGKSGKKGLYNASGEQILPPVYEAMGNFDGTDISLLRSGKFGIYRPSETLLIAPVSEKLLQAYGKYYFIGSKNGKKGLIDKSGKEMVPYRYQEILYWNDTVALVNESGKYSFHLVGGDPLTDLSLTSVSFLRNDPSEKLIMGFQEGFFGVYSNTRGEILPPEFDDIINIGTSEVPVYFTETFVRQADLHVVVYYDKNGRILKKQAMEPAFFSEIYCDQ